MHWQSKVVSMKHLWVTQIKTKQKNERNMLLQVHLKWNKTLTIEKSLQFDHILQCRYGWILTNNIFIWIHFQGSLVSSQSLTYSNLIRPYKRQKGSHFINSIIIISINYLHQWVIFVLSFNFILFFLDCFLQSIWPVSDHFTIPSHNCKFASFFLFFFFFLL